MRKGSLKREIFYLLWRKKRWEAISFPCKNRLYAPCKTLNRVRGHKSIVFTEFREVVGGGLVVPFDLIEGDIFFVVIFRAEFVEVLYI